MKLLRWVYLLVILFTLTGCANITELRKPEIPQASRILDANGEVITVLAEQNRQEVPIQDISIYMRKAMVAIEDYRFYQHNGFDFRSLGRAAVRNIAAGRVVQGGSTITQQTAKNLYLTQERTFGRKFKEAFLTVQLERRYTKDEILGMYLNQIYFGSGAYGVEVAANTYFGKHSRDLTLAESALLAGIPRRPSHYSPFINPKAAKERQELILDRMAELNFITSDESQKAKQQPLIYNTVKTRTNKAPYFVNEVIRYITDKYEDGSQLLYRGGLTIYTTLDLKLQAAAEKAFTDGLQGTGKDLNGALIALDPKNGGVKAMIGGRDYEKSQFNRALQAKRQPGSAFKPFVYTAAIDRGDSPSKTIMCEYTKFQGNYQPTDYGSQPYHYRPFTLREALKISDNVVAVKLNQEVGPDTTASFAKKMGITSSLNKFLSLALGTSEVSPLELARAYGPLATQGKLANTYFIQSVQDSKGVTLEDNKPKVKQVLRPEVAYVVTDMLRSVVEPGGTAGNVKAIINRPAAGKTGTTQNYRDAWFVGYTPDLAAAIYIGYDSPTRSVGSTGGKIAAPIWAHFVALGMKDIKSRDFPIPDGVTREQICEESGYLATPYCPKIVWQGFVSGTQPTEPCPIHRAPSGNLWGEIPETIPEQPGTGQEAQPMPGEGQMPQIEHGQSPEAGQELPQFTPGEKGHGNGMYKNGKKQSKNFGKFF